MTTKEPSPAKIKREQEAALRRLYRQRYAEQRERDRKRFKEIDELLKRAKQLCYMEADLDI